MMLAGQDSCIYLPQVARLSFWKSILDQVPFQIYCNRFCMFRDAYADGSEGLTFPDSRGSTPAFDRCRLRGFQNPSIATSEADDLKICDIRLTSNASQHGQQIRECFRYFCLTF